jgi:hypothetical protein
MGPPALLPTQRKVLRILSTFKSIALPGFEPVTFGSSGMHTNLSITKTTFMGEVVELVLRLGSSGERCPQSRAPVDPISLIYCRRPLLAIKKFASPPRLAGNLLNGLAPWCHGDFERNRRTQCLNVWAACQHRL